MGAEYWVQLRTASCPFENSLISTESQKSSSTSSAKLDRSMSAKDDSEGKEEAEESSSNILGDVHGLEFHFDKDEQAAEEDNWIHPKYSTTTYLDAQIEGYPAGGAPLIIFQTNSEEEEEEQEEEEEEEEEKGGNCNGLKGGRGRGRGRKSRSENMEVEGDSDCAEKDNDHDEEEDEEEEEEEEDAPELVDITELNVQSNRTKTAANGLHNKDKDRIRIVQLEDDGVEDLESDPRTPASAWAIYPEVNRHVSFPGGFLHGVAGELLQPSLLLSPVEFNKNNNNNNNNNDNNNKDNSNNMKYNTNTNTNTDTDTKNSSNNSNNNDTIIREKVDKIQDMNTGKKCYNYSRLSLLVNIWTNHKPKMVQKLQTTDFNSELKKLLFDKNLCDYKASEKKNKGSRKIPEFNFQNFVQDIEKNEKIPCLTFSPKIKTENSLESNGPRCYRNKLSNRIYMEEEIDDGVIRASGNGINANIITECHTKITEKSNNKTDPGLHYLKEHRVCDTGPVPIEILKKEFQVFNQKKIRSKVIRIKYIYE
jgi:hypothetical protein